MARKVKHIKIWDGWKINHNGEETICESPKDVWEFFGWDIENDPNADGCASLITREMYCFGFIDISQMLTDGGTLTITAIPPTENDESEWEEVEDTE